MQNRPLEQASIGARALADCVKRWKLTAREPGFETNSSWLQKVSAPQPAVLKIAKPDSDERPGMALLDWWQGQGAIGVLRRSEDAILMVEASEKLALGDPVQFDDHAAFEILVGTAAALHGQRVKPDLMPDGLVPLTAVREHVFTLAAVGESCFDLWRPFAQTLDLMGAAPEPLHGDIHHGNVLRDEISGDWVVIDPKGLYGHLAYDFANLFFNPMDQPARVAQPERMMGLAAYIERKVPGIADRHVVLDFAYLYGGMSLLWGWHETWAPQRLQQFQMLEKLRNQAFEQHH
ncbi:MAG: aminoglycoside phosphotransferase family protein [Alphaproteobacteria bacterium]